LLPEIGGARHDAHRAAAGIDFDLPEPGDPVQLVLVRLDADLADVVRSLVVRGLVARCSIRFTSSSLIRPM
jgi:hypothetical protein